MHRESGGETFLEALAPARLGRNAQLERIAALVDWAPLAEIVSVVYAAPRGRPAYPPLLMVKALLLGEWYDLSDEELEAALWDRLSFRRFVGLGLQEDAPDRATVSRFRRQLARRGLAPRLFAELNRQLEARGLVVTQGTLLDATVVEAQVRRPGASAGPGGRSPRDPDASWTRKRGRASFGYQAHLGVDQGSGLVRRAELHPAHVNESQVADALIVGDERAVYADRAYEHQDRRRRLRAAGVKDRIAHRRHKHLARLPHWQQRRNRLIERRRSAVERVFATLKQHYGYRRVRYRGLARNTLELLFTCMAYNLRRADALLA